MPVPQIADVVLPNVNAHVPPKDSSVCIFYYDGMLARPHEACPDPPVALREILNFGDIWPVQNDHLV